MDLILILIAVAAIAIAAVVVALVVRGRARDGTSRDVMAPVAQAPPDLKEKLSRTRTAIGSRLGSLMRSDRLDDSFWDDLEETLIAADVGVTTAAAVTEETRSSHPEDGAAARAALEGALVGAMSDEDRSLRLIGDPAVVLVVGVNGTGKTTSIAKLAARMRADQRRVILAAADTFRAAADDQLRAWADRVGVEVVTGEPGSDPAAVAYETYQRAAADGYDTVIVDTAGRLQSKSNLMDELGKVARVLRREAGEIGEVLLVLDGTTG
ncbi:MAG: signal recognition particle receptor subunit alpha, partial [Acidimicrobiia bacterium]